MAADVIFTPQSAGDPSHPPGGPGAGAESLTDSDSALASSKDALQTSSLLAQPSPELSPHDPADFLLHPSEIAKGRRAAENYLSSFRSDESRTKAEEALETLATVISAGKCDSFDFPWHQVRPYHGAAVVTILKAKGAPARVETLLCRRDSTRSFRMVPDAYPPRQVQKIKSTLSKVIEQCSELGFTGGLELTDQAPVKTVRKKTTSSSKSSVKRGAKSTTTKKAAQGRLLSTGELRALMASCAGTQKPEGFRDSVLFALVHRGLKIAEITALRLEDMKYSSKTGACHVSIRPTSGGRGRRIELTNEELIYLEDWLDCRGDQDGPLLCGVGAMGKIEGRRITTAALKAVCESRGEEAEVEPFVPNDLSRSADALTSHRKAVGRKAAQRAEALSEVLDGLLFENQDINLAAPVETETIRFPFLGLGV